MNVSIVGGSGFIGTHLVRRVIRGNNILIIDKVKSISYPSISFIADICNIGQLKKYINQNSVIINLAAEHRDDVTPRYLYDLVNIEGARNICDVAREKNIKKIIFTSSVAVYGFAPISTNESGIIYPYNDYGRTKWEAEKIYKQWQAEDPESRTLVIIRPTVVFGEGNRGNIFNLMRQIALGRFLMVGNGKNRKSIAYVENVAAFLEYSLNFKPGLHIYNYVDKPDFTMNDFVAYVNKLFDRSSVIKFRLPFSLGILIGFLFDVLSKITGKKFPISFIRVKKFCTDSVYESAVETAGFIAPISLIEAIDKTVRYEFFEDHKNDQVFFQSRT